MKKATIWTIIVLVGGYVICQAIADIGATKLVFYRGITFPAGTFVFALTFTLRDLLHKRLGKEWARAVIIMCGIFNVVQAGYLAWVANMPFPPFFALGEQWGQVFAIVPAVTAGSIISEVISQLVDTEVYHVFKDRGPQWVAVLLSNAISLPLDSFLFGVLAFVLLPPILGGEPIPFLAAMSIVAGQILWKAVVTIVSLPTIYLVKDKPIL